ncbi:MAG: hypothetical protein HC927_13315 [Deltaproteobacteria bacterium]|nr:hypothetical protein [Deltaproteobacteria bacterium]
MRSDGRRGRRPCDAFFGYAWTGLTCKSISGCECSGADCDSLYQDQNQCWDDHALCELPAPDCEPEDAKGEGFCDLFLGWAWDGNQCVPLSGCECIGADCDSLPLEQWECDIEHANCDQPPPPDCVPMEAKGVGLCALFLGYAWDGKECVGLSGCSCEGNDCGNLYQEIDECKAANAMCL